jgi:60 kDa SS-A/Ro ribonucleoprotein
LLTKDAAANVRTCLKLDGKKTVDTIVQISTDGRAPKNDAALFALAIASVPDFGSAETAQYALSQLNKVARKGTHLFHFVEYLHGMRGWGSSVKNIIGRWYTDKTEAQLAFSLTKYQSRDGWSNRDLLRLSHIKTVDARKKALLAWCVSGGLVGLMIGDN